MHVQLPEGSKHTSVACLLRPDITVAGKILSSMVGWSWPWERCSWWLSLVVVVVLPIDVRDCKAL